MVPKLRIWLLRGWGRCLKVTLQTHNWSEVWRWQANIVTTIFVATTINFFCEKNEKTEKCLELSDLARKLIKKTFWIFFHPHPLIYLFFVLKKTEKRLELPDLARKLIRKIFWKFPPPRHVRRKISARVDGGTSGPSSVRRRGARTPIGASGNL